MAARRNFYSSKFSEYRQNYLPFDYYDFWITAKENENLRFKNKLRDYLHTPFDWDEDLDVHREQQAAAGVAALERANQATQTSDRPNRHDQLKKLTQAGHPVEEVVVNAKAAFKPKRAKTPTKSAGVQVSMHEPGRKPARRVTRSAKQIRSSKKTDLNNDRNIVRSLQLEQDNQLLSSYKLAKSMTNMAIQTPFEWKLRDYSKREPSKSASSIQRSTSVASLQPRRPPFANYGWATQTKDLSKKPTRNALANKVLARKYHDENAVCELKLQALKKEATALANEQCALESKSLDRFHSDSREWLSEYENKYPDHTKSAHKHDYYHSVNPNKLKKSSLVDNNQSLRVPKSTSHHKIYY